MFKGRIGLTCRHLSACLASILDLLNSLGSPTNTLNKGYLGLLKAVVGWTHSCVWA